MGQKEVDPPLSFHLFRDGVSVVMESDFALRVFQQQID